MTQAEARRRLAQDGPNALPVSQPRSLLRLVGEVVAEPMFLLLVACGALYMVLGNRHEALMLLGFVFVVMGITFVQQRRTERSLEALRDLSSPLALVLRDGQTCKIAARELVRGDTVLLAEGDRVPADMELVHTTNLALDESLLTGESMPVQKQAGGELAVQAFSGTLVTQGSGQGRVVATGERSALGRIGQSLQGIASETTPTQRETNRVVKSVALVGVALATALALAHGLLRGDWLGGLLAGLTLAMAILPEELPVILALFLSLGAWRLSRQKVLAHSIPAVELLGATTVLCVDKTGTLTANRMAVRRLRSGSALYDRRHDGAAPLAEALHGVLEFAVLASHRRAYDPMEAAIIGAGAQLLAHTEHLHADWTLVEDYPLSPSMLAMSRVWRSPDLREYMIAAKGAPEAIVDLCHLPTAEREDIARQVSAMADEGLRVLGVASAVFAAPPLPGNQHDFDFVFLGLVGLEDPLRPDVPQAIAACHAAGIRVVMMTGDHPVTALAIARQAGLATNAPAMTGQELADLPDDAPRDRLDTTQVFCRVQPEQKLRLVQAFRARGDVVAMTGDGVNDAPSLKAAHIGVAMGARGTEVARQAADLVLLNDDFASIVTAVRYGRRVFANLRKAIVFVVGAHVPIVGLSLIPVLLGWPMLLMPVHVVFLQLIIDPACSVVFEAEPLEADSMAVPPRSADAHLFDRAVLARGLWQGGGLLALLLGVYAGVRALAHSDEVARAMVFTVLVLCNLELIYANRSWTLASWRRGAERNRYFGWISVATLLLLACVLGIEPVSRLFAFELPTPRMLVAAVGLALLALLWFEGVKWALGRNLAMSAGQGDGTEASG
ncbi:Calcium-transporting ATPase [Variovorax sp. PBS-H4]|nr:cation-translocating P-type ATPase [Variovorax sp. PBS-H4]VTU36310.1 Calcium-transporting ATPase [Variovorax sp. PBS-H4]